jgi:hypothetical protein
MFRRWIIRSIFILLVVAVSAMWVRSWYFADNIDHLTRDGLLRCNSEWGRLSLYHSSGPFEYGFGWYYFCDISYNREIDGLDLATFHHLAGFEYGIATLGFHRATRIKMPYWFIDSVAGLIGLYAWWKTRPKPNPATAFPVEARKVTT